MVTHTNQFGDDHKPASAASGANHDASDAHDALADLFLGELRTVAAHDAAMGLVPRPATVHHAHQHAHPHPPAHPSSPRRHHGPLIADLHHADLLAHTDRAPAPRSPANPQRRTIEAIIVGHVPIGSAPWLTHFARESALAAQHPVALLRVGPSQAKFELFGETGPRSLPSATITDAIDMLAPLAAKVLVHVDSNHALRLPAVARVTILCGADEAAIVDTYRRLKDLAAQTATTDGAALPQLAVSIVGTGESRAAQAFARLADSARRFLGLEILSAGSHHQITGGPLPGVFYNGSCTQPIDQILAAFAASAVIASTPARSSQREQPPPITTTDASHTFTENDSPASSPSHARFLPVPGVDTDDPAINHPEPEGDAHRLLLASHLPGLTCIAARCPFAPDVELAVDRAGRLHTLAGRPADQHLHTGLHPIEALAVAASWAKTNLALLSLSLPDGRSLMMEQSPVQHLFTREPAHERALLDSTIRIHALASVAASRSPDWVCVELN